ncbi:MAG: NUDIX domain-containing protein [Candidatus Nezhaarchaeales archaeon]
MVSALIERNGKLLFIKRGETPKRGYYSFPEGHLKVGESIFSGVVRECREEIGCNVEPIMHKVLVLEGPSNATLPDNYLEISWPPLNGRIGMHNYRVIELQSSEIEEPPKPNKMYFYIPCMLNGEPRRTSAALDIIYMTPKEALELKVRGRIRLMPTTSIALALIELGEFKL